MNEPLNLKKSGNKAGKVTLAGAFGLCVEAAVTAKFPLIIAAMPPGTITAVVAGVLYAGYDVVKRKWFAK